MLVILLMALSFMFKQNVYIVFIITKVEDDNFIEQSWCLILREKVKDYKDACLEKSKRKNSTKNKWSPKWELQLTTFKLNSWKELQTKITNWIMFLDLSFSFEVSLQNRNISLYVQDEILSIIKQSNSNCPNSSLTWI